MKALGRIIDGVMTAAIITGAVACWLAFLSWFTLLPSIGVLWLIGAL